MLGAAAARGERISHVSPAAGLDGAVQRKLTVNPGASAQKPKVAVIGDGTPANQGLAITDLNAYVTAQADWFSEPSFTQPDRDAVWRLLLMLKEGPHMVVALGALHAGAVVALAPGDLVKLKKYAGCFDAAKETVQLTTPVTTMVRALQLGQTIIDLEGFVPTPVLRVVIPASGLIYLVDKGKIPELKKYYQLFKPTLESPDEWTHIEQLLTETWQVRGARRVDPRPPHGWSFIDHQGKTGFVSTTYLSP